MTKHVKCRTDGASGCSVYCLRKGGEEAIFPGIFNWFCISTECRLSQAKRFINFCASYMSCKAQLDLVIEFPETHKVKWSEVAVCSHSPFYSAPESFYYVNLYITMKV